MIAFVLLPYAALLLVVVAPLLDRAEWPERSPRLAISAWLALTTSALASVLLAGLSGTFPMPRLSTDPGAVFYACLHEIRQHYSSPMDAAVGAGGAILVVTVAGRLVAGLRAEWRSASRERARHHSALRLANTDDGTVVVVPCAALAAYSLPRPDRIVVTSGAHRHLAPGELAAVLAHERAHLRQRHHSVVLVFAGLRRAFGWVPAFEAAERQARLLVEYVADDQAARLVPRSVVASAIARVGNGPVPASSLGVAGADAVARTERLSRPAQPLRRSTRVFATGAVLLTPSVLLVAPILATLAGYCA